jgi:hypothetical protein
MTSSQLSNGKQADTNQPEAKIPNMLVLTIACSENVSVNDERKQHGLLFYYDRIRLNLCIYFFYLKSLSESSALIYLSYSLPE